MKITRLFTGIDGESHFEEIELPLEEKNKFDVMTKPMEAKNIVFRESVGQVGGGDHLGWHTAPCRLLYILLGGTLEIEVGDGSKRLFKAGDVFLAEDTTGRGHLSRAKNRQAAIIPLD
jgi:quercetin dioxygenase-like cupin family protein